MSRKDFVAIAAAIKDTFANDKEHNPEGYAVVKSVAENLCGVFADANPRFDRARFLAACGVTGGAQ